MGWLRDLMQEASPPLGSYGDLARRALGHPAWPEDVQPKPRSLAALLSKLDRGIETEWLGDRPEVQQTLAAILDCPVARVREAVQHELESFELRSRRFRFDEIRYARPLELSEEGLPPGIPRELLSPASWKHTWWIAKAGAGRSLVGRWLDARRLARWISIHDLDQVPKDLDPTQPLFVELYGATATRSIDLDPLLERPLCVASPTPPPDSRRETWQIVESPAVETYLEQLLEWLAPRLPSDGQFDAAEVYDWIRTHSRAKTVTTFGACLGLAGLADELGIGQLRGKSLKSLAKTYVDRRLREAQAGGSSDAQWLARFGFECLIGLAVHALTDSDEPWEAPRDRGQWLDLVPSEYQQGVDSQWVRTALSSSGQRATVRDVERALSQMPPGAFRVIRGLENAGLLRPAETREEQLVVAPLWLRDATLSAAIDQLTHQSPVEWGEALLRGQAADAVLERLYTSLKEGDTTAIHELLDLDPRGNPAFAIAVEAALCCTGLALLDGLETGADLLGELWREGIGLSLSWDDRPPCARLLSESSNGLSGVFREPGAFLLGALALAEAASGERLEPHELNPWTARTAARAEDSRTEATRAPFARLHQLLETIGAWIDRPSADRWRTEAYLLVDRLLDLDSVSREPGQRERSAFDPEKPMTRLERPSRIVRALGGERFDWDLLEPLWAHEGGAKALVAVARGRSIVWDELGRAVWRAFQEADMPADEPFEAVVTEREVDAFFPLLSAELLDDSLRRGALSLANLPHDVLSQEQWRATLEAFDVAIKARADELPERLWQRIPLDLVVAALDRGDLGELPDRARRTLWQRDPSTLETWVISSLETLFTEGQGTNKLPQVFRWLRALPSELEPRLIGRLKESFKRHTVPKRVLDLTRRWLFDGVRARGPEWRLSYEWLAELERRRERLQKRNSGHPRR